MIRLISIAIFSSFFIHAISIKTVFAGFEWVPPMQSPASLSQNNVVEEDVFVASPVDTSGGFPAPEVSSEPLPDNSVVSMPISILPDSEHQNKPQAEPEIAAAPVTKNLSGKKLVINPYPLRNNIAPVTNKISMLEMYKSLNEESGDLHPVKLGNGMTTGAKKDPAPLVPKAVRMASTAHKTFLTPTGNGMTPMMGVEPAPLPGMAVPRSPVKKAVPSIKYAEAIGFGRDLPLALALSQVIPTEFIHSFAKDVDAGVSVSWEGGKPWDQVLNDMLSPQNLTAVIQGNQVIIQKTAKL